MGFRVYGLGVASKAEVYWVDLGFDLGSYGVRFSGSVLVLKISQRVRKGFVGELASGASWAADVNSDSARSPSWGHTGKISTRQPHPKPSEPTSL